MAVICIIMIKLTFFVIFLVICSVFFGFVVANMSFSHGVVKGQAMPILFQFRCDIYIPHYRYHKKEERG